MTDVRLTHIGGPTVLIEVDGRRLLTDPTFDAPGRRYVFGWGTSSRKLAGGVERRVGQQPPATYLDQDRRAADVREADVRHAGLDCAACSTAQSRA